MLLPFLNLFSAWSYKSWQLGMFCASLTPGLQTLMISLSASMASANRFKSEGRIKESVKAFKTRKRREGNSDGKEGKKKWGAKRRKR